MLGNFGLSETVILVILLLVILFPTKIKEIARNFGESVKEIRNAMNEGEKGERGKKK